MALLSCPQSLFSLPQPYPRNSPTLQYPSQLTLVPLLRSSATPSLVSWNQRCQNLRCLCINSMEGISNVHFPGEKPPSNTIFIRGLPYSISEAFLMKVFSQFGSVDRVNIIKDRVSKESVGIAFIWFTCEEDAKSAVKKMNGKFFEGRFLRVMLARPEIPRKKPTPYKF